jgi:hypothetical protein
MSGTTRALTIAALALFVSLDALLLRIGAWQSSYAVGASPAFAQALYGPDILRAPLVRLWLAALLAGVAFALVTARFGTWRRLARQYPAKPPRSPRARVSADLLVLGRHGTRNSTWLEVDDTHLHVSAIAPLRLLRQPFSVPLSDITAVAETGGPLPQRFIRLIFARDPGVRFMVWPRVFEKIATASGGRLQLDHGAAGPPDGSSG